MRNIVSLSIPIPHPPVGGSPYSRAVQKFSSTICASSSPAAFCLACSANLSLCTRGSLSSVYALTTSFWQTNSSNLSVRPGTPRCLWGCVLCEGMHHVLCEGMFCMCVYCERVCVLWGYVLYEGVCCVRACVVWGCVLWEGVCRVRVCVMWGCVRVCIVQECTHMFHSTNAPLG